MTKTQGSRNYNQAEESRLLAIVAERLPVQKADWENVAVIYNSSRDSQWKERSAASLKRKFMCLYSKKGNGTSMISKSRNALELKRQIIQRAQVTSHLHNDAPSEQCLDGSAEGPRVAGHATCSTSAVDTAATTAEYNGIEATPPSSAASRLPESRGMALPTLSETEGSSTPQVGVSSQRWPSRTPAAPKHIHCDAIQLFLWFQHRDEQQRAHWIALEQQRKLDISAADRRHQELLQRIASLKATPTN